MNRPSHFDISADDPKRAIKFYEGIFGWEFEKWDGPMEYWMIKTGPKKERGINGGLSKKGEGAMPNMNTIEVSSVDKVSKKIEAKGGKILMPKSAIPKVGWFATFQDPEGNVFGIMEEDKKAK
ncbi:MAG: VOC family protein [Nitrososphaera sp.]|jgi:predicted enzyme related to lactoylglutathione lyase